ncbi:MAG: multicopper oxidase domain-containing protein [Chromatiales bacterium]|jgi:FtsP/CotA-like multicopper oxidase with cupredoxin domain
MNISAFRRALLPLACALTFGPFAASAAVLVQCPGDTDGDAIPDAADADPNVKCLHLVGGDGFVNMADGYLQYIFGFADVTGIPSDLVLTEGLLAANFPAPTIVQDEGDLYYLTLTNVGMVMRPDLFDPHTVHYHGFPNASPVFDGLPESGLAIGMAASLTYFYNVKEPGTYMYHCHAEATEHMQMGMLGSLYVRPAQNKTGCIDPLVCPVAQLGGNTDTTAPLGYAYNDGDGSTAYDVEYPVQIGSFDKEFHDASLAVQPLPFAAMKDDYPMLNGRGYPDTLSLTPPTGDAQVENGDILSQPVHTLIEAISGQRILLRVSNLNITRYNTLAAAGLSMRVIARDARLLRGPDGKDLSYATSSITLGGGEAADVIIDTTGVAPGTYFLYSTNLELLSNNDEIAAGLGGMLTEIRVN